MTYIDIRMFYLPVAVSTLLVEGRVESIEVLGIQMILGYPEGFAEPLEVDDLPFTEEPDGVTDFRVFDQPEDVVVSEPCLLLCCDHIRTILG